MKVEVEAKLPGRILRDSGSRKQIRVLQNSTFYPISPHHLPCPRLGRRRCRRGMTFWAGELGKVSRPGSNVPLVDQEGRKHIIGEKICPHEMDKGLSSPWGHGMVVQVAMEIFLGRIFRVGPRGCQSESSSWLMPLGEQSKMEDDVA